MVIALYSQSVPRRAVLRAFGMGFNLLKRAWVDDFSVLGLVAIRHLMDFHWHDLRNFLALLLRAKLINKGSIHGNGRWNHPSVLRGCRWDCRCGFRTRSWYGRTYGQGQKASRLSSLPRAIFESLSRWLAAMPTLPIVLPKKKHLRLEIGFNSGLYMRHWVWLLFFCC